MEYFLLSQQKNNYSLLNSNQNNVGDTFQHSSKVPALTKNVSDKQKTSKQIVSILSIVGGLALGVVVAKNASKIASFITKKIKKGVSNNIENPVQEAKAITQNAETNLKPNFLVERYNKIINKFPEDKIYYEQLATDVGLKKGEEYKLSSVVGTQQLGSILKTSTLEDFTVGQDLSGVKNRTLRLNLHNHTTASDGKLSPFEMIEQARKWADEVHKVKGEDGKTPFILAITDHDTLDGAKEAVKIVASNPEKYKNLKLVLGSEISVSHTNSKDVKSPMNFELIGYGLNPFNKGLNSLFDNTKKSRASLVSKFVDKVQKKYDKYDLNMEVTQSFHANLKNMRTNGCVYLTREYLIHKIMFSEYVKAINEKIIPKESEKLSATDLFRGAKDDYYFQKDTKKVKGVNGVNGVNGGDDNIAGYYRDSVLTPILEKRGLLKDSNKKVYEDIFKQDFSDKKDYINKTMEEFLPTLEDSKGYIIKPEEVFDTARKSNSPGFFGVVYLGLINTSMYSQDVEKCCNE